LKTFLSPSKLTSNTVQILVVVNRIDIFSMGLLAMKFPMK
jgi:hypothetical protein